MRTGLYEKHLALGAKMVDFAGWEMPVQYKGIIHEHHAVRNRAGMFDVSHMGRVEISGKEAEALLDYLSTNAIAGKPDGSAVYTVWCHESGGSVDDLIVYRQDQEHFFVIVNASNRQKDLDHLIRVGASYDVKITPHYEDGILAVQGPEAVGIVSSLYEGVKTLKPMTFLNDGNVIISATGYTGSGGVEIYAPMEIIMDLWDRFLNLGVEPVGLGARDTLRLEMGYALYGHELSDQIAPVESVSRWTIKWSKENFLGKEAELKLKNDPQKRHQVGIVLTDRGIAREGYEVYQGKTKIGTITSGTHSPTLNKAIAIAMLDKMLQEGETVEVDIRGKRCAATVTKFPFLNS